MFSDVEAGASLAVGLSAAAERSVGGFLSATIAGERLRGDLAGPGADWLIRACTIGVIDVRMTIRTDDGALIQVSYGRRLDLSNPAQGIVAYVAPVFETRDERYAGSTSSGSRQGIADGGSRWHDAGPRVHEVR